MVIGWVRGKSDLKGKILKCKNSRISERKLNCNPIPPYQLLQKEFRLHWFSFAGQLTSKHEKIVTCHFYIVKFQKRLALF